MSTANIAAIMIGVCFLLFIGSIFTGNVVMVVVMTFAMRYFFTQWDKETSNGNVSQD